MSRHFGAPVPVRRSTQVGLLGLLGLATLVLSGCLGPDAPDPTGTAPFGHLDSVVAAGDGFRAVGWVADPNTRAPITVTVSSEQRTVKAVAGLSRPDVGRAHPEVGSDHGFDVRFPGLGPGAHQVCVWADNVGAGTEARSLGCTVVTVPDLNPFGVLESVAVSGDRRVRVTGFALDRDTTAPIDVGVLLDGSPVVVEPAALPRADIAAAFGNGSAHGFWIDLPAAPGRHQICVIASNVGWGSPTWLGCRTVTVPASPPDHRPTGSVTGVVPVVPDGVRVTGVATDPDTTGPVSVRVVVDDGPSRVVSTSGGGFDTTIRGLAGGRHEVCVTALDIADTSGTYSLQGDRSWPCGTVILGDVAVGSSGAPSTSPTPVGPSSGSPLARIDRDAGVSVQLRDGSVLWLFGDSTQVDSGGRQLYFVNNTAAWAAAGAPTVTQDGVSGVAPYQFVTPAGASWTCPADKPTRAMWPLSAVATPSGSTDVVTAFFGNVCLGSEPLQIASRGVAVVRWTYDPASPPASARITGTVVNQQLFDASAQYGTAAVADGSWIYGYQCSSPPDGPGVEYPNQFGPCTVGRVATASVAVRDQWRFWNGTGWVADVGQAAPIIPQPDPSADPQLPVSSMTVTWDAPNGVFVMAYSPWPGFTDRIFVRVATSPQGPWSEPVLVTLPGCNDSVGSTQFYCYAGTAQPELSSPGLLGLGYYDQLVAVGPNRGQYLTITVPFSVVITPA
jgi:hypothetical protein